MPPIHPPPVRPSSGPNTARPDPYVTATIPGRGGPARSYRGAPGSGGAEPTAISKPNVWEAQYRAAPPPDATARRWTGSPSLTATSDPASTDRPPPESFPYSRDKSSQ